MRTIVGIICLVVVEALGLVGCGDLTDKQVREVATQKFSTLDYCSANSDCRMINTRCGTYEYNFKEEKNAQEIAGFCDEALGPYVYPIANGASSDVVAPPVGFGGGLFCNEQTRRCTVVYAVPELTSE